MISKHWADGRRQLSVARCPPSVVSRLTAFCLLLTAFFAFALSQAVSTSPTFDEGFTLLRGYAAWRTGHLVPIGHPPLAHWLSALGVVLEPNLPDPRTLDGWYGDKYDDSSRDLLWKRDLNASRLVLLGRFPIILLGVLLGAVTFRWAKDLFGWRGAFAALALHALSPNLLAHSAVATTDMPVTAFYFFTLFAWHRFTRKPSAARAAFTGLMLGCALAAKFSALLLLPTLGLLFAIYALTTKTLRVSKTLRVLKDFSVSAFVSLCLRVSVIAALALITLWAMYGFALHPYPLAQFVHELTDLGTLAGGGHTAYLFGQLSPKGWWYYHPVVFLVKTPLPLLILIAIGLWRIASYQPSAVSRQPSAVNTQPSDYSTQTSTLKPQHSTFIIHHSSFIISPLLYLAVASLSSLNVGYRYLLPALPFLHIIAATAVSGQWAAGSGQPSAIGRPAFSIRH
ncbi:MAG: glycosyltransferase family 39 protein, partial [Chloroflexi bacterium]|nr:glycosyltransferase family 39 protein [Chloroflexota bacterium]